MDQIIDRPVSWNMSRDNTEFNLRREVKMLIEEIYELLGYSRHMSKQRSELFVAFHFDNLDRESPDLDGQLDALGDLLFIAAGSIGKLDHKPSEILEIICDHNDQKGSKKDIDGKIIKDSTFIEPVHVPPFDNNDGE